MRPQVSLRLLLALLLSIATFLDSAAAQKNSAAPAGAVDWKTLIPQIPAALGDAFDRQCNPHDIAIVDTADLTGNGTLEALVDYCQMGAYTDSMTVMRVEDRKPVEARFRDGHGKPVEPDFLDGAFAMHGAGLQLAPKEHAVLQTRRDANPSGQLTMNDCSGTAYVWNPGSKSFDSNPKVSAALVERECRKIVYCENHACPPEKH